MRRAQPLVLVAALAASVTTLCAQDEADWPTYNHDANRSAVSPAPVSLDGLGLLWEYASPAPIRPAWPGPAQRDYYNSPSVDNEDRLDIDSVFHVAAVGDRVFFGSSIEDSLRCLNAETGESEWVFTADGPVRFAPHVLDGDVYFGADDGFVYCVGANDGALRWATQVAPSDYAVPSDGKWVSLWPNRTGVIVRDGRLYCGVGVFPSEGVYVAALSPETGEILEREVYNDMSLQGYVLASAENLFFPGGRSGPWVFERATMERRGQLGGGGGTYAVVTETDSLIYGPGRTSAALEEFDGKTHDSIASYPGAKHIVVTPECSYIATRTELFAFDRNRHRLLGEQMRDLMEARKAHEEGSDDYARLTTQIEDASAEREACRLWVTDADTFESLILADDVLFAGGAGHVTAFSTEDGKQLWSAEVSGRVRGLAAAQGRLLASTDESRIYCFGSGL